MAAPKKSFVRIYPVSASLSIVHVNILAEDAQRFTEACYPLIRLPSTLIRICQYVNAVLSTGAPYCGIKAHLPRPMIGSAAEVDTMKFVAAMDGEYGIKTG